MSRAVCLASAVHVRNCRRKRKYHGLPEAKRAASRNPYRLLYAYRCPLCGAYHLTKQKGRNILLNNQK